MNIQISSIIVFIIVFVFYLKFKYETLLFIPVLEAIREVFLFSIPNNTLGFLVIYSILTYNILNNSNSMDIWKIKAVHKYGFAIKLFIFILVLGLFRSTDVWISFKKVWEYSIVILISFVSILYVIKNRHRIDVYIKACYIGLGLHFFNMLFFSFLKVGTAASYGGHTYLFLGGLSLWGLYMPIYLSFFIILLSIYNQGGMLDVILPKNKKFIYSWLILNIIFFAFVFLIGKRTYIFLPILGLVVFIIYFYKFRLIRYLQFILFLFLFYIGAEITGFNDKMSVVLFENRNLGNQEISKTGRYLEYYDYIQELHYRDNQFLISGNEIFNSRGKFFQTSKIIFDRDRILHSDVTHFLYGIGILGLVVFFFLLARLYAVARVARRVYRDSIKSIRTRFYWSAFAAIFFMAFAHNFSGGIFSLSSKIIQWQMMGILIGLLINENKTITDACK
jgi:hypothetical protein